MKKEEFDLLTFCGMFTKLWKKKVAFTAKVCTLKAEEEDEHLRHTVVNKEVLPRKEYLTQLSFVFFVLSSYDQLCVIQPLASCPSMKRASSEGALYRLQVEMMWLAVCLGFPHFMVALSVRPQFFTTTLKHPTPVLKRFRRVHPSCGTSLL